MFSNNDKLYIPISGGTGWTKVPMNSNYPSQEIGKDGNMYAPVSEVNKPRTSVPIISNTNIPVVQDSRAYNSTSLYVDGLYNSTPESRMNYYIAKETEEKATNQQEALITANINKALDIAASTQYRIMDKLYIEGGLDAMRKEYYRLSAGTEGYNSVYARAAYNSLCAKDKEETLNTPAVTKGANEYYEKGGINSLKYLVKYYEDNNYFVYANIAKRILKQKEGQERVRQLEEQKKTNNLLTATLAKINKQLPMEDKELLSYPPEIIGNPDATYKYLAEIEPLTKALEDIKQGNFSNNTLANSYWTEKEALLKKLSQEAGYTDFEKLIEHYIKWKGNTNLNEPAYSDEGNVYLQANERQMAIDIGLKNFKPTQNDTKKINEKYSHYQTVVTKAIEVNNTKINKVRNVSDMADDILHKRNPSSVENLYTETKQLVTSAFEGVKEAFVETGEFIGEEIARLHLGEKTKTRKKFDDVKSFFVEEKQRFDKGETTKTRQILNAFDSYLKKEDQLIAYKKRTQTEQFIRDTYQKVTNITAEEIGHGIGKFGGETLIGFGIFKGASALVNGTGKVVNAVKTYKRSASLSEVKLVKEPLLKEKILHNNNSKPIVTQYNNHNANNANAQKALNNKMSALQDAQKYAVKTQEFLDGRIRYYAKERPATKPGITRGSSYVTEYNPNTGQVRSWIENYNHDGSVNRIHPKMIDGRDIIGQHYPPTGLELNLSTKKLGDL